MNHLEIAFNSMKKILLFLLATWFLLGSCSDDFLEKNQRNLTMLSGMALVSSQVPDPSIEIELGIAESEAFYIASYPIWMEWESMHGRFDKGVTTLKFKVKRPEGEPEATVLSGIVILDIDRIGLIGLEVVYGNIGNLPGASSRIIPVSGSVKDAAMHKPSGMLVLATQSPDQLWVYKLASGESFTIPLPHTPQCIDLAGEGKTVVVGNTTPNLLLVNIESRTVVRTFPLDCVAFDVVAADNVWCYIAPQGSEWTTLRSLNLSTGKLVTGQTPWSGTFYSNTIIRKVPGKPLLMGTRPQLGPTGILLVDISKGVANDTINYYHQDLGNFWVFNDGNRFISRRGSIFPIPSYSTKQDFRPDPVEIIKIQLPHEEVNDIDFSDARNAFFVASVKAWQTGWNQGGQNVITQYQAGNYSLTRSYEPSLTAIPNGNEVILAYSQVKFVFSSGDGNHLYAVRRMAPEFGVESWSIEEFEVR